MSNHNLEVHLNVEITTSELSPNESENGQDYPHRTVFIAAQTALTPTRQKKSRRDIGHFIFHPHRQDENLAYFASPTAHTTWIFLEENGLS